MEEEKGEGFYRVYEGRGEGGYEEFNLYSQAIKYLMSCIEVSANLPDENSCLEEIKTKIKRYELLTREVAIEFPDDRVKNPKRKYTKGHDLESQILEFAAPEGKKGIHFGRLMLLLTTSLGFSYSESYVYTSLRDLQKAGKVEKVRKSYYRVVE
jgi:hypothetical protein